MRVPLGTNDFGNWVTSGVRFIDKTLFIKTLLDDTVGVTLITRPRRFGKTANLNMLYYFLSPVVGYQSTAKIFDQLKIAKIENGKYIEKYQGQFPTIFLSLKDIKGTSFDESLKITQSTLAQAFTQHQDLLESDRLLPGKKAKFADFLYEKVDGRAALQDGLRFLTECLERHYQKKCWVLLDEYDTPLYEAYSNGYWVEMSTFMRGLLGAALKDNPCLYRAVVTGILRVARESLFSDLNNIVAYTLLDDEYGEYFGFTESEVEAITKEAGLESKLKEIKDWYNGYQAGQYIVYNPWSIMNCLHNKGKIEPYWVNTSENKLIGNLLIKSDPSVKSTFEKLLQGESVERIVSKQIIMSELETGNVNLWTLLYMSGYLKAVEISLDDDGGFYQCQFQLPNREVLSLYHKIIQQWLTKQEALSIRDNFLTDLLKADMEGFENKLTIFMQQVASTHDVRGDTQENFYHALMLGTCVFLNRQVYEVRSNRESGYGRFDVIIFPKLPNRRAAILEFKAIKSERNRSNLEEKLQKEAEIAFTQINEKVYSAELAQRDIDEKDIIKVAVAFSGKRFVVFH